MRLLEYKEIASEILEIRKKRDECIQHLTDKFPKFSADTLSSIYSQLHQRKIKKEFAKHHKRSAINRYTHHYHVSVSKKESEGILCRLADDIDFPPTLLARIVLEDIMKENSQANISKAIISQCIKRPQDIPDKFLSREIEICIQNDQLCGPIIESIKRDVGLKYEKLLHDTLMRKDIAYYHEDVLRKQGYDKTPDFKLVVPILADSHVIHWIESKALFGDEESHSGYLENQFWSYTNRFGPGLVIYWFGFINELNVNVERGLTLSDCFPTDVITLESLLDKDYSNFNFVS